MSGQKSKYFPRRASDIFNRVDIFPCWYRDDDKGRCQREDDRIMTFHVTSLRWSLTVSDCAVSALLSLIPDHPECCSGSLGATADNKMRIWSGSDGENKSWAPGEWVLTSKPWNSSQPGLAWLLSILSELAWAPLIIVSLMLSPVPGSH